MTATDEPQAPAPDTKDWTWVLERPCPDCGFDARTVDVRGIGAAVRADVPRWQAVLARPDARRRPAPGVWSPTEYAAHVRDVLDVFSGRVRLVLDEDDPLFPNWDQDATALAERYDLQHPDDVARALARRAATTAALFDAVPDDAWERPGRRSNGSVFTLATLGAYFLHDVRHHLHDVRG
ncbi:DinB family protein [Cellulomonas marina]|uniref:DinB superfamily protein n=1 Tax=Cellulomonas marina TaxID=988821 RepID=A0A1I0YDD1_9CELL|nr:DinB family protein [Cellulomonas marina]GIG28758.1 methyltransferase type 12 [Cellulomonas marina]SFB11389.1 DinB superfamily protein [Cellulomonas marina]